MFDGKQGGAFRGFHHMGYITNDLSKGIDMLRKHYGLEQITECGEPKVTLADGNEYIHKTAMGFVGPWGVELIQPTGGHDRVYRDELPKEGFGFKLHHVCYSAPTREEFNAAKQGFIAAGNKIALDSPAMDFFYADTRAQVGHYTEFAYLGNYTDFLASIARV